MKLTLVRKLKITMSLAPRGKTTKTTKNKTQVVINPALLKTNKC